MNAHGPQFPEHVEAILFAAKRLTGALPDTVGIGVAGSWARGEARHDSDVDLVVLTTNERQVLDRSDWHLAFGSGTALVRSRRFGDLQERRLVTPDLNVIEVCIGGPDWASTTPLDEGTRRVVTDGFVILYDPVGLLERLAHVVSKVAVERRDRLPTGTDSGRRSEQTGDECTD